MVHSFDTLVIGSGLAGLSAAIEASRHGSVAVIAKLYPTRCHSSAAQGGIAAALGNEEPDSPEWHVYDTIKGSDYLADQDAARTMCEDAIKTVIGLEHLGVPFSRISNGKIAQRRFGGHTKEFGLAPVRRACYCADRTGLAIVTTLYEQSERRGIRFFTEFHVLDIIMEGGRCLGAAAIEIRTGEICAFTARATILATGGYGRVFRTTSNAIQSTGDLPGVLLAKGLPLEDMEFFQFHPTGLYGLGILVTEGARGEGGVLINGKGERFMERYAPHILDLAPRDMVSRAIITEIREGRGVQGKDFVYLDLRAVPEKTLSERLPEIMNFCKLYMGVDPSAAPIPVVPTAHYAMGGIPTDPDGRVRKDETGGTVPGLFAAGECACVSVHGANRLGCNSLLDTVVFGRRAGEAAGKIKENAAAPDKELKKFLETAKTAVSEILERRGNERAGEVKKDLQDLMMQRCSVFRNEAGLKEALRGIGELKERVKHISVTDRGKRFNTEALEAIELGRLLDLAEAIAGGALERKESRGAHSREDYPERDDKNWLKHSFAFKRAGEIGFRYKPVAIAGFPPKKREY
ncbi:MAG: succinate dehydrogenase flavoprotein subunit [Nitrospiraceae bacterium]|nr:succinate dehydrogenase flavoprotein subunit [Nitrospiraceae bacterium]